MGQTSGLFRQGILKCHSPQLGYAAAIGRQFFPDRTFNTEAGQRQKHRWLGAVEKGLFKILLQGPGAEVSGKAAFTDRVIKSDILGLFENSGIHFSSQAVISAYGPQQVFEAVLDAGCLQFLFRYIVCRHLFYRHLFYRHIFSRHSVFCTIIPVHHARLISKIRPCCSRIRESGSGRCRPQSPVQIHRNIYWLCPW